MSKRTRPDTELVCVPSGLSGIRRDGIDAYILNLNTHHMEWVGWFPNGAAAYAHVFNVNPNR